MEIASDEHMVTIYYFSGTGNSRNVARWFAECAAEKQITVSCIDIATTDRRQLPVPSAGSLTGFCSPTHGFNFPPVMVNFLIHFPRSKGSKVFIVNTRGGMKLGKWFMPGLSGIAQLMAAIILLIKGYKVVGMRPIDLPSNWISLHPGLKGKVVESIHLHWKQVTKKFASQMLSGKKDYRALYDILQDLLIAPVSLLYYFIGRFMLAKTFYANHHCDNCGLCASNCPVKAILSVGNRPFWSYRCESCMRCMNDCPKRAIETGHGFLLGALLLINAFAISYYYSFIANVLGLGEKAGIAGFLLWIGESFVTLAFLILLYRLMHFLLPMKTFSLIMEYTSLTHFRFWRRYRGRKIKL
jgi:Pyruvate/2-oxoacid:ferredoxin oxidoreductase delta subunit/flavodoxin